MGNNEIVILSTRKQTVKDVIFLYSENFGIYTIAPIAKIRSTELVTYFCTREFKARPSRMDPNQVINNTSNNSNCSPRSPFTSPFTVAIGPQGTSHKATLATITAITITRLTLTRSQSAMASTLERLIVDYQTIIKTPYHYPFLGRRLVHTIIRVGVLPHPQRRQKPCIISSRPIHGFFSTSYVGTCRKRTGPVTKMTNFFFSFVVATSLCPSSFAHCHHRL